MSDVVEKVARAIDPKAVWFKNGNTNQRSDQAIKKAKAAIQEYHQWLIDEVVRLRAIDPLIKDHDFDYGQIEDWLNQILIGKD